MTDHLQCPRELIGAMADMGVEVYVTTEPPEAVTAYPPNPMTCPHGTTFYMQPTNEQIETWEADRTP